MPTVDWTVVPTVDGKVDLLEHRKVARMAGWRVESWAEMKAETMADSTAGQWGNQKAVPMVGPTVAQRADP